VNFTRTAGNALPVNSSIVWTGTLTAPESGKYRLHLQLLRLLWNAQYRRPGCGQEPFQLLIHGEVTQAGQDNVFPTTDGLDNLRAAMELSAGPHQIRIEGRSRHLEQLGASEMQLGHSTPAGRELPRCHLGGQAGKDRGCLCVEPDARPAWGLPGDQDQLIRDVAAINPNTIVVLNVSQPVAMPWLGQVKAVLDMGWTGDEGGWATAKVLLGQANPGGRLPFTWPKQLQDTPANDPAFPERSNKWSEWENYFQ
jgi:beta-glucosidase